MSRKGRANVSSAERHGLVGTPEYSTWKSMIQRCTNPNRVAYKHYGGRGIRVCERWRWSFLNFWRDMGPRPSEAHSLDRIDLSGDYEPGNCRWATPAEQARNRTANRWITFDGRTQIIADWAQELGVSQFTLYARLRNCPDPDAAFREFVEEL